MNVLTKYPMRTQIVQTGLIMASGDVIAQLYLEKVQLRQLDLKRTARFGFIGMTFVVCTLFDYFKKDKLASFQKKFL